MSCRSLARSFDPVEIGRRAAGAWLMLPRSMDLRALSRRFLPRSLHRRLRRSGWLPGGTYDAIAVDAGGIREGAYKQHLGGGAGAWDRRGEFQLQLLRDLGLEPGHRFLDVGCGPLRAGRFFLRYLDPGCYAGVDYKEDFIEAARHVVREEGLEARAPQLAVVQDFDLEPLRGSFDRALAFSVLHHCDRGQRQAFFRRVPPRLAPGARLYITHARWFTERALEDSSLRLVRILEPGDPAIEGRSIVDWGWQRPEEIFPIVELELADADAGGSATP